MDTYILKPGTKAVRAEIHIDSLAGYKIFEAVYDAVLEAAAEARMKGAPGHARISFWYDREYLRDYAVIDWPTPVLGSEPLPDRPRPSHYPSPLPLRLGNIPR